MIRALSLGAGVQSSRLLLGAAQGEFGPPPDVAVFADTGWEPMRVYGWLAYLEECVRGVIPIQRVYGGDLRGGAVAAAMGKGGKYSKLPLYVSSPAGGREGMPTRAR